MEKSIIFCSEQYFSKFKTEIQKKAIDLSFNEKDKLNDLLEFIFEYEKISYEPVFTKKIKLSIKSPPLIIEQSAVESTIVSSVVNIPDEERCIAEKKQGDRCNRKKTKGNLYCGTHCIKYKKKQIGQGTNNNETNNLNPTNPPENLLQINNSLKSLEVVAHEIQGIIYYIDKELNVYNTEDIFKNINNPRIIANAVKLSQNVFSIPSLGL